MILYKKNIFLLKSAVNTQMHTTYIYIGYVTILVIKILKVDCIIL